MASLHVIALLPILLVCLQPKTVTSDFLTPLLAPAFDSVCKQVECGKGKCKPSPNSTFFYECDCDLGWSQTSFGNQFKFLPCVIPNCTINYNCSAAPPPVQDKSTSNQSVLDVCRWTDCGGGSCNRTSPLTYSCECDAGYSNLLNVPAFPCYKDCALGMDCMNLGISSSRQGSSPPPALADNAATSVLGSCHLFVLLMLSLVMV